MDETLHELIERACVSAIKPNAEQAEYLRKAEAGENLGAIFTPSMWFKAGASSAVAAIRDMLAAALQSQSGEDGWLPIETAPKDGTPLMVGWSTIPAWHPMVAHYEDGYWGILDSDFEFGPLETQPTHWRPLPSPPQAKDAVT